VKDGAQHRARERERERELRRGLDQARRQRDGAEARAARAEARVVELEGDLGASVSTAEGLAARLAAAAEEVEQAVARAERRSAARIAALEAELAAARAQLEQQRRDVERDRVQQAQLRGDIEDLQARLTEQAAAPRERTAAAGRPLMLPDALQPDTTEAARWLIDTAPLLLVDGYNVTLLQRADQPLEAQRRWLVDRLRPLVSRGRCRPVVVFDGDRPTGATSMTGGVEVRFTGGAVTADDDIVFSVAATDEAVVVVTDDRELRARAIAEGANVLGTVHLLGAIEG
jgi:predicted RNA-binding protein with PIN domain